MVEISAASVGFGLDRPAKNEVNTVTRTSVRLSKKDKIAQKKQNYKAVQSYIISLGDNKIVKIREAARAANLSKNEVTDILNKVASVNTPYAQEIRAGDPVSIAISGDKRKTYKVIKG